MANFIDFIEKAIKNSDMVKDFIKNLESGSADNLAGWFKDNGYEITNDDADKLIRNKDKIVENNTVKSY